MARLPQNYGLVPITTQVLDGLGSSEAKPFGDAFWFLSPGVDSLAQSVSHTGPVAYLDADISAGQEPRQWWHGVAERPG